jgi:hypothetical protein
MSPSDIRAIPEVLSSGVGLGTEDISFFLALVFTSLALNSKTKSCVNYAI